MIRFVDDAAKVVRMRGEEAFAEFNRLHGKWYHGDRYITVIGMDGVMYVCPPEPKLAGRNQQGLRSMSMAAIR